MTEHDSPVSFDDEMLILVDDEDRELGHRTKTECHRGDGLLHRAFSIFLFDPAGRVLLQQRSGQKRLWPLHWSNACCSHPRKGETFEDATRRRLKEELGLECALRFLFRFRYQARFGDEGSEHELCRVYAGRTEGPVSPNRNEIEDCRWTAPEELTLDLQRNPQHYTPWLRMEWERMRTDFPDEIRPPGKDRK